ncbi:MAG: hypothetical protein ACFFGZ_01805 [Candidatus Thorarchaeota archaeon]
MPQTKKILLSREIIPEGTTLFRFFLEDYWLFRVVDRIERLLPHADWTGIFDGFSSWEDVEFTTDPDVPFPFHKKAGEGLEAPYQVQNYTEAANLEEGLRQEYRPSRLVVSPTHIVSRLSYEHYVKNYPNLKILSLDAHDDHGETHFPDNLWISDEIAANTLLIGGRAEKSLRIQEQTSYLGIYDHVEVALASQHLKETLRHQDLLLSIDLDYFQRDQWGFPTYLAREFFIGHSMNITQRIMSFLAQNVLAEKQRVVIGKILGLFASQSDLEAFTKKRLAAIRREGATAKEEIGRIRDFLTQIGTNIVSVDLCGFCAPLDYEDAGTKALIELCKTLLR